MSYKDYNHPLSINQNFMGPSIARLLYNDITIKTNINILRMDEIILGI